MKNDDGSISYIERRGIREIRSVPDDGSSERSILPADSENPNEKAQFLNTAATALITAAGEKSLGVVIAEAKAKKSNNLNQAIASAVLEWVAGLAQRHGALAPVTAAAQFTMHQYLIVSKLMRYVDGAAADQISKGASDKFSKEMMQLFPVIYAFCNAWHWWRVELDGDHAKIIDAEALAASRQKGATANRNKKEQRLRIIRQVFEEYRASGESVDHAATVADKIKATAKTRCLAEGLGFVGNDQLTRIMRDLILAS
jgi:hypothetical protein